MVDRIIKNIKSTLIIICISTAIKYNEKYKKKPLSNFTHMLPFASGWHSCEILSTMLSNVYLITLYTSKQIFSISDFPAFYISRHVTSASLSVLIYEEDQHTFKCIHRNIKTVLYSTKFS